MRFLPLAISVPTLINFLTAAKDKEDSNGLRHQVESLEVALAAALDRIEDLETPSLNTQHFG